MLLASSSDAACVAIKVNVELASSLELTKSFSDNKFMVIGTAVSADEQQPIPISGGLID